MQLQGKVAFVTGASGGIGRATAVAMARAGAKVAVVDLKEDELANTVSQIAEQGGEAMAIVANTTDRAAVRAAVAATVDRFGRLDCAHNNAGVSSMGPMHVYPFEDFRRVVDVNLHGTFHCMQAEIEVMLRQGGGTIVNTASVAAMVTSLGSSAYSSSKHAVIGLTRTAALEYAGRNIRVNAVCPGFVETAMTDPMLATADARKAIVSKLPIGRVGTPQEIADVVVWLSSPQSSYIIGAAIIVDGGYTLV